MTTKTLNSQIETYLIRRYKPGTIKLSPFLLAQYFQTDLEKINTSLNILISRQILRPLKPELYYYRPLKSNKKTKLQLYPANLSQRKLKTKLFLYLEYVLFWLGLITLYQIWLIHNVLIGS